MISGFAFLAHSAPVSFVRCNDVHCGRERHGVRKRPRSEYHASRKRDDRIRPGRDLASRELDWRGEANVKQTMQSDDDVDVAAVVVRICRRRLRQNDADRTSSRSAREPAALERCLGGLGTVGRHSYAPDKEIEFQSFALGDQTHHSVHRK